jgi:hypothetical protein
MVRLRARAAATTWPSLPEFIPRMRDSQPVYYLFPARPAENSRLMMAWFCRKSLHSACLIMRIIRHGFNVMPLAVKKKASGLPLTLPSFR